MRIVPMALTLAALAVSCSTATASIQDDYRPLVERRINLEHRDKEYVERRSKLDETSKDITMRWGKCAGGRWAVVWSPFEARLQEAQRALGKTRNEVYQLKLTIMKARIVADKRRRAIETKYADNKGALYEEEFREYMDDLDQSYLMPYEEQYLYAVDQYLTAVEVWQESANEAIKACNEGDISAPIVEGALKNLGKVFEGLDALSKFFKK